MDVAAGNDRAWAPRGTYAGNTVGPFRLITEIGRGGMSVIYLASDTRSPGTVRAVKLLREVLSEQANAQQMFLDEARIASCIRHENVVRVWDYGVDAGLRYLAMDYVLGETLHQVRRQTRSQLATGARMRPELLLAHVLAGLARGLHGAHETCDAQGLPLRIVHRDISPQNVMVGYDGRVRLLDFGIAKAVHALADTLEGQVKGRFTYMAPEQMRGFAVDRRADLWSLGVLLWEGLTDRRLFRRGSHADTIMAVTYGAIPRADAVRPDAPRRLCDLAEVLLQREPGLRPDTALHVARALEAYLAETGSPVGEDTVARHVRRLFGERAERRRVALSWMRGQLRERPPAPPAVTTRSHRVPRPSAAQLPTTPFVRGVWARLCAGRRRALLLALLGLGSLAGYCWLSG